MKHFSSLSPLLVLLLCLVLGSATHAQNVGIGTAVPASKLHVVSPTIPFGFPMQVEVAGTRRLALYNNGALALVNNPSPFAPVNPNSLWISGNVSIGNNNPTQMLDVSGQIRLREGNPAAGRVLTSIDANGNAEWQDASAVPDVRNGINTDNADFVELGGTLIRDTEIDQDGNGMAFTNGNVGIGAANTGGKLNIVQISTGGVLQFNTTGNGRYLVFGGDDNAGEVRSWIAPAFSGTFDFSKEHGFDPTINGTAGAWYFEQDVVMANVGGNVGIGTTAPTNAKLQVAFDHSGAGNFAGIENVSTRTDGSLSVVASSRLGRVGDGSQIAVQGEMLLTETTAPQFTGAFGIGGSLGHPLGGTIQMNGLDARAAAVSGTLPNNFSVNVTERQAVSAVFGLTGMHNSGGGTVAGGGRIYAGLFQGNGRLLGLRGENSAFMEFLPDAQQRDYRTAVIGFYNAAANGGNNGGSVGSATSYFSIEANIPGLGDDDTEDDDIVMQFRTEAGRVGIGEDNPDAKLHVTSPSGPATQVFTQSITAAGGTATTTINPPAGASSVTLDVRIRGDFDAGLGTEEVELSIDGTPIGTFSDNQDNCNYSNVATGLDVTAQVLGGGPVDLFSDVTPDVNFDYCAGGVVAQIEWTLNYTYAPALIAEGDAQKTGGGNWDVISDRRVKDNIQPYTDGLDMILGINPKTFRYTGEGGIPKSNRDEVGIIAQELQQVAPYMVTPFTHTDDNGETTTYFKTNTSALDFAFVNAFKELTRRNSDLKARVDALEAEKQSLKATIDNQGARLKRLERMMGECAER